MIRIRNERANYNHHRFSISFHLPGGGGVGGDGDGTMRLGPYELNQIYTGDARELSKAIPDGSIDLIFTDPPYPKEFLPLYEWLAREANRVLKSDGFLLTYAPGYWKNVVIAYFDQHLDYFWDYAVQMDGDSSMIWPRKTIVRAKSILAYRPRNGTGMPQTNVLGLFKGAGKSKQYHIWGQDEDTARYFITCFSKIDDVIFEPFLGGGTTCVVSKIFGRNYVSFDIDPLAIATSKNRLNQVKRMVRSDGDYQAMGQLALG